jgi:two-component system response regulator DctR
MDQPINVVLIEDDPMVQEVNRQFVERVEPFQVVGIAGNGAEGIELIKRMGADLIILDMYMPVLNGMETLRQLQYEKLSADVIMITAAKDVPSVQKMLRNGVFDYIIKPFKFERVKQSLDNYRMFRSELAGRVDFSQPELDRIWQKNTTEDIVPSAEQSSDPLPKGLNAVTMKQILKFMSTHDASLSAEQAADGVGIARVTARRYLEFLEKSGKVSLDIRYGGIGRPINRYYLIK